MSVNGNPIGPVDPGSSVPSLIGDSISIDCAATGDPLPTISWLANGSPVVTGDRLTVDSASGRLTIASVEVGDQGTYTCVASNDVGQKRSSVELAEPGARDFKFSEQILTLFCRAKDSAPVRRRSCGTRGKSGQHLDAERRTEC